MECICLRQTLDSSNRELIRSLGSAPQNASSTSLRSIDSYGIDTRYTAIDNTHITLAFIGEYPDPYYVLDAMANISFKPFNITLKGFGNFGDLWWTGLDNSEELRTVVRSLRHFLSDAEIPYDRKKFSPHITLIRKAVCHKGMPRISVPHKTMIVSKITLYRSDRGKHGMIYTELGSV